MTAVLCVIMFVISVLSAFLFNCSLLFSIAAALISAALFVVEVFLFKESKVKSAVIFIAVLFGICVCVYAPPRPTDHGVLDHAKIFEKYISAVASGKQDKTEEALTEITEKYGEDDYTRYIHIGSLVESGNISKAEELVSGFSNKHGQLYLMAWEEIINKKYVSEKEVGEALLPLFIDAADYDPDWWYPAKNAGGLLYDRGEYSKAEYYLTRALTCAKEDDPELLYYLGATLCEQELYEKGIPLLNEAYDLGISEDYYGNIAYYVSRSGMGGNADDQ